MGEYFSGRVHTVKFVNPSQDFYVLVMVLDDNGTDTTFTFGSSSLRTVTVRGHISGLQVQTGTWFGFEAKWETHAKYGRQLVIQKAPVLKDGWTAESALSMLAAHDVGPALCDRIGDHFGRHLVAALDENDPDVISEAPGITPFAAAHILSRWTKIKAYFLTLEFLSDAGVPKSKIRQVWSYFGDDAEEVLSHNPWALIQIEGITFGQADEVALRLGLDMNSPLRASGAVLFACKTKRGMGHLFLTSSEMVEEVQRLVPATSPKRVIEVLAELHKKGLVVIDRKTRPGTTAIYEPWFHQVESECADMLVQRVESADPLVINPIGPNDPLAKALEGIQVKPYAEALSSYGEEAENVYKATPRDLGAVAAGALRDWSRSSQMILSGLQLEGALNALTKPVSILTGLPGTGKSTTLIAVASVLKDVGIPFLLCAPTGIAAKRMSSLTGSPASTIHRAFGAKGWDRDDGRESTYAGIVGTAANREQSDGSGELWDFGPDNPHPARVVICDESSMVDQHILYRLLSCTSSKCRLVFVGDAAQLPSVGPGNVLRDLIKTGLFPTVSLTEIFRQEEKSDIVVAAHATVRGQMPDCNARKDSDFVLIGQGSEEETLAVVSSVVRRLYTQKRNFQVLSPRHAGTLGVTNLNQVLRDIINPRAPGLTEMRLGSEVIREDDRVMVVKNNYSKGIFNGDVGKVVRLDRKAREIEIKLHGPPVVHVRLGFAEAPRFLRLAYAMTIHKSQGQEYDVIVMPFVKGFWHQLQRNLFYTAITRARERVFLVGHRDAVERAVENNREDVRNTLFPERLLGAAKSAPGGGFVLAARG